MDFVSCNANKKGKLLLYYRVIYPAVIQLHGHRKDQC